MNGGTLGAMHIDASWGDTLLASLYGTNAVAWGSEPAREVFASMMEEPEAFFAPDTMQLAAERGTCLEKCRGLPTVQFIACMTKCGGSVPGPLESLKSFGTSALVGLAAVGLIIVGAVALTQG